MSLKLMRDRNERNDPVWHFVGRQGTGSEGKLIAWTPEDEQESPWLAKVPKLGRVLVAPLMNPDHRQHLAALERKNRRFRGKDGLLPSDVQDQINYEAASRHVLLDWEGIELEDGTGGAYTPAKGLRALQESGEFEAVVVGAALDLSRDRSAATKEDAKHLGNGSSGSSDGDESSTTRSTAKPGSRK
jgi:hypothetical protein